MDKNIKNALNKNDTKNGDIVETIESFEEVETGETSSEKLSYDSLEQEEVSVTTAKTKFKNRGSKFKHLLKDFSFKKLFSSISKTLDENQELNEHENTSEEDKLKLTGKEVKPLLKVDNPFKRFFVKNTLTIISNTLDEDVDEINSLSDSKPDTEEIATPSKKKIYNRRMYYLIGVSFTIMSIIGLIFTANLCVNTIKRFTDNTAQKERFAKYIYPLVVTDMPPYESIENLSDEHIITAAIWDLIMFGELNKYESNFDVITVPAIDIERHATKLFGEKLTFNHKTFMASSINFYYDDEIKSYNIPISPTYYSYIPEIERIEKDGKKFTLLVAYKRDTPSWLAVREDKNLNASKYIEYIILEEGNNYKITSLENVSNKHDMNVH